MTLLQSILLGLIQGLGEFLPISSSGHLVLAPWLLNIPDPGLSFDVALHLGTLLAVVLYFWKDFWEIILNFNKKNSLPNTKYPGNILYLLILATIPGAAAGYFLEDYAETIFRQPMLVAGALLIMGILLFLADKYARNLNNLKNLTKKEAFLIGLSQAVAIIPGVSRSGSTITTGLFLGLDRISAARFSFLLSAPIIFGATILKFPDFIRAGVGYIEIIGILTAALSGYLAIAGMIKFIERVSYKVFFWYRLVLALLILIVWLVK